VYICVFMSYSTSYCVTHLWIPGVYVCMYICIYVVHQYSYNPNLTRLSHKYVVFAVCLPITNCNTPLFGSSDRHTSIVAYTSDILSNRRKGTVSCFCRSRFQGLKSYDALAYHGLRKVKFKHLY